MLSSINSVQNNADLGLLHDNALSSFRGRFYSSDHVNSSEVDPQKLLRDFDTRYREKIEPELSNISTLEKFSDFSGGWLDRFIDDLKDYYTHDTPEFLKKKHIDQYFDLYREFDNRMNKLFLLVEQRFQEISRSDYVAKSLKNTAGFADWIATAFLIYAILPISSKHGGGLGAFLHYEIGIPFKQEVYNQLNEINGGSVVLFFVCTIVLGCIFSIPFWIYDYIANKSLRKNVENKNFSFPDTGKYIDWRNNYFKIKNTIELDIQDSHEQLEKNKIIYEKLKDRAGNAVFDFAERQANLLERLTIMQAELKHAKKISENLTEQHGKTEAIRAKYAREMVDAQAMLNEQSDKALQEKLDMLNTMMKD